MCRAQSLEKRRPGQPRQSVTKEQAGRGAGEGKRENPGRGSTVGVSLDYRLRNHLVSSSEPEQVMEQGGGTMRTSCALGSTAEQQL